MSTYVREKVLRVPINKIDFSIIINKLKETYTDYEDDFSYYLEELFPDLFGYATVGKFQLSPTETPYLDFVLEYEWDCVDCGDYGKTREMYDSEKDLYRPVFQKISPDIDMNLVRVVEFCWYNCSEADDYYDPKEDSFYKEIPFVCNFSLT